MVQQRSPQVWRERLAMLPRMNSLQQTGHLDRHVLLPGCDRNPKALQQAEKSQHERRRELGSREDR